MAVYFIQVGKHGPVKVGMAGNVRKRFNQLQCANPQRLRIVGTRFGGRELEEQIHRDIVIYKIRGEWHHPHPVVMNWATDKEMDVLYRDWYAHQPADLIARYEGKSRVVAA